MCPKILSATFKAYKNSAASGALLQNSTILVRDHPDGLNPDFNAMTSNNMPSLCDRPTLKPYKASSSIVASDTFRLG